MRVSHETIYKRLYMRTNEALGRDHPGQTALRSTDTAVPTEDPKRMQGA